MFRKKESLSSARKVCTEAGEKVGSEYAPAEWKMARIFIRIPNESPFYPMIEESASTPTKNFMKKGPFRITIPPNFQLGHHFSLP